MTYTILHYIPDSDPECLHGASGGVLITDSESVMLAEFASINTEIIDDLGRFILVSEDFYYNFISTNHCEEYIV